MAEGVRPARHERGSALLLVPAGVLVLVAMAAVAVDSALVFLAERRLADAAAAAANDAAGAALDEGAFYLGGEVRLDPALARATVVRSVAARTASWSEPVRLAGVDVDASGAVVRVALSSRVRRLFGRGIPGASDAVPVQAVATAQLEPAPGD